MVETVAQKKIPEWQKLKSVPISRQASKPKNAKFVKYTQKRSNPNENNVCFKKKGAVGQFGATAEV